MIDGDEWYAAVHQLEHARIVEVHTGNDNTVHASVETVLQIRGGPASDIVVDKSDIIAVALRFDLEALQHG